jgi:hypothetical protein
MPERSNPYAHVPFCEGSSQVALSCPACRWKLLKWSAPRWGQTFAERLTADDEQWLALMNVSCSDITPAPNTGPEPRETV